MSKLAIVIPAYKSNFIDQALLSIADQTKKDFTLYIGNDCSPDNLYDIVEKYQDIISIVYVHFDENLGSKDLVAQWERCIDLVADEEWIWLFSDDDLMDKKCVENFYNTLNKYPDFDLFHFNVQLIDEKNNYIQNVNKFPTVLRSEDFLYGRLNGTIHSTVVEYIFRKSYFQKLGRFQKFDLAWGSDDATWIKLGNRKGIKSINNSLVFWRKSLYNISTNYWDKELLKRKLQAELEFAIWVKEQANKNQFHIDFQSLKEHLDLWFYGKIKHRIEYLPANILIKQSSFFNLIILQKKSITDRIAFIYIYKTYRYFINRLK